MLLLCTRKLDREAKRSVTPSGLYEVGMQVCMSPQVDLHPQHEVHLPQGRPRLPLTDVISVKTEGVLGVVASVL